MQNKNQIHFSESSGFDRKRAIELANLIEVAYSEFETWHSDQTYLPSQDILGCEEFVDLEMKVEPSTDKFKASNNRLDQFWRTKTAKEYDRLENFWATEWWLNLASMTLLSQELQSELKKYFETCDQREESNVLIKFLVENFGEGLLHTFTDLKNLVIDAPLFGFMARAKQNPSDIFIVFRGTREEAEWINNFKPMPKFFLQKAGEQELGEVRNGFNNIYAEKNLGDKPTIKETIGSCLSSPNFWQNTNRIFITGHSLGAALATLASVHIQQLAKEVVKKGGNCPSIYLYTFASPRVGGSKFAENFDDSEAIKIDSYRIFNTEDIVPSLPFPTTQIVDEAILKGMQPDQIARLLFFRGFLEKITGGQSIKKYQHVGLPVPFTNETGTIAGNHNLTKTYREALQG